MAIKKILRRKDAPHVILPCSDKLAKRTDVLEPAWMDTETKKVYDTEAQAVQAVQVPPEAEEPTPPKAEEPTPPKTKGRRRKPATPVAEDDAFAQMEAALNS